MYGKKTESTQKIKGDKRMKKFLSFTLALIMLITAIPFAMAAKSVKPGDIDGNSVIDSSDATFLARYLAKWNVEIDTDAGDCNGDGVVNLIDAILLAQYLDGWNVVLGGNKGEKNHVVDAIDYSKKISSEFDGMGLVDTHHTVVLPKLNYDTAAADALNKKIMKNHGDSIEILKAGTEDRTVYQISYSFNVCRGIVGIMVSDSRSMIQSYRDQDYFGYYYDIEKDEELGYFEYLEALGVDYSEMVGEINKETVASGMEYSTDYTDYVISAVLFDESSFTAEVLSPTWGTYLREIPVSIVGHSNKKYDVQKVLVKWYEKNKKYIDPEYEWYGELTAIKYYDMDVDGVDEICFVYGDSRFTCVFYRLENGIYDMECDIGPGWGTGYIEDMFLATGEDGIVTAHFSGTDYSGDDIRYTSYEYRYIDGEWKRVE